MHQRDFILARHPHLHALKLRKKARPLKRARDRVIARRLLGMPRTRIVLPIERIEQQCCRSAISGIEHQCPRKIAPAMSIMKDPVTWLYPPIEPFNTGRLQVSALHEIYYEESGNPAGKPVIFLHGGPGGGSDPKQRRFFHPHKYRIVNFDQRGCGKSTPYASLEANTTWDLVADIEKIREHLVIERWQVLGRSSGSTLALAYAETHPERVTELVLRGIFMLRRWELEWFYQKGCDALFPDSWEAFLAAIPAVEHGDLMSAYHRRLTSSDPATRLAAAQAWSIWEGATSFLLQDPA